MMDAPLQAVNQLVIAMVTVLEWARALLAGVRDAILATMFPPYEAADF